MAAPGYQPVALDGELPTSTPHPFDGIIDASDSWAEQSEAYRFAASDLLLPKLSSDPRGRVSRWLWLLGTANAVGLVLSVIALALAMASRAPSPSTQPSPTPSPGTSRTISRIAFGSCSSYDARPQLIWTSGVIPSEPDAWVWLGDLAYLDMPPVECAAAPALCNCSLDWLRPNPGACYAGDFDHARDRMAAQLAAPEYRAFLSYMCPHAGGRFPPPGGDPAVCPRPIFGVYDDHDYGANNANRRLPGKDRYKQLYLDAIGEPADSVRRSAVRGLYDARTLNPGQPGREIQLLLLDERYERDPVPCQMRRAWCQAVLARDPADPWCRDFLLDDGRSGAGSCCWKDEQAAAWCAQAGSKRQWPTLHASLCNPLAATFGTAKVALTSDAHGGTSIEQGPRAGEVFAAHDAAAPAAWANASVQAEAWRWLAEPSPVCELLGPAQRSWLQEVLGLGPQPPPLGSPPPALRIIASGSVLLGSLGYVSRSAEGPGLLCSGDDWACYEPAQLNLLHTLANASRDGGGCAVVLTGDYHFADIKVALPGNGHPYSGRLSAGRLAAPVYQAMASGMSDSTAVRDQHPCPGSFVEDVMGLRPGGPCAFTGGANFGFVNVDWAARRVELQIRDAGGRVARSAGGQDLSLTFSLDTCLPL